MRQGEKNMEYTHIADNDLFSKAFVAFSAAKAKGDTINQAANPTYYSRQQMAVSAFWNVVCAIADAYAQQMASEAVAALSETSALNSEPTPEDAPKGVDPDVAISMEDPLPTAAPKSEVGIDTAAVL
jgi:hypothetical protein